MTSSNRGFSGSFTAGATSGTATGGVTSAGKTGRRRGTAGAGVAGGRARWRRFSGGPNWLLPRLRRRGRFARRPLAWLGSNHGHPFLGLDLDGRRRRCVGDGRRRWGNRSGLHSFHRTRGRVRPHGHVAAGAGSGQAGRARERDDEGLGGNHGYSFSKGRTVHQTAPFARLLRDDCRAEDRGRPLRATGEMGQWGQWGNQPLCYNALLPFAWRNHDNSRGAPRCVGNRARVRAGDRRPLGPPGAVTAARSGIRASASRTTRPIRAS